MQHHIHKVPIKTWIWIYISCVRKKFKWECREKQICMKFKHRKGNTTAKLEACSRIWISKGFRSKHFMWMYCIKYRCTGFHRVYIVIAWKQNITSMNLIPCIYLYVWLLLLICISVSEYVSFLSLHKYILLSEHILRI